MHIIQGIPASPGYAAGPAFHLATKAIEIPRFLAKDPAAELARTR